jgi:hypothetical protein
MTCINVVITTTAELVERLSHPRLGLERPATTNYRSVRIWLPFVSRGLGKGLF